MPYRLRTLQHHRANSASSVPCDDLSNARRCLGILFRTLRARRLRILECRHNGKIAIRRNDGLTEERHITERNDTRNFEQTITKDKWTGYDVMKIALYTTKNLHNHWNKFLKRRPSMRDIFLHSIFYGEKRHCSGNDSPSLRPYLQPPQNLH